MECGAADRYTCRSRAILWRRASECGRLDVLATEQGSGAHVVGDVMYRQQKVGRAGLDRCREQPWTQCPYPNLESTVAHSADAVLAMQGLRTGMAGCRWLGKPMGRKDARARLSAAATEYPGT